MLIILPQYYRQEKEEPKEVMVLEVVTDGKNDKTGRKDSMTRKRTVHSKRTRAGTCVLFCVPPSFVLIDNKCIPSCAIIWSKHEPIERPRKQRRTENETVVFIFS